IEKFQFSDGSYYTENNISEILNGSIVDPTDSSEDIIYGTDAMDYMEGYEGNNTYYAGKGNDYIKDGWGNDTYLYDKNQGMDVIKDSNGTDAIVFGEGLSINDVMFFRYENNMHICFKGSSDKIDVWDWFAESRYKIEKIQFADGTEMTATQAESKVLDYDVFIGKTGNDTITGTGGNDLIYGIEGNDVLYAKSGNDIIYGGSGNDIIYGDNGNDIIKGETGNDMLYGGSGNDTYESYNELNFGIDTINDSSGTDYLDLSDFKLNQADFSAFNSNSDSYIDGLRITFNSQNIINIMNYFDNSSSDDDQSSPGDGCIEYIYFSNATVEFADIQSILA
ncbi:MAG: calcium-binding protein, partial [Candidatus Gastranaerophilales bacterium]|nr:calcium-binding protein [Candidatus Gastranaerophilales bacterium]